MLAVRSLLERRSLADIGIDSGAYDLWLSHDDILGQVLGSGKWRRYGSDGMGDECPRVVSQM